MTASAYFWIPSLASICLFKVNSRMKRITKEIWSMLTKLTTQTCNFIKKETLVQMLFCEFNEFSRNPFFHRAPLVAASEQL